MKFLSAMAEYLRAFLTFVKSQEENKRYLFWSGVNFIDLSDGHPYLQLSSLR